MTRRTVLSLSFAACAALAATTAAFAQDAPAGAGGEERRYVGEPIDLSLRDDDLVETLRSFAELGGFNLVVHPGVEGKVTVELKQVPWDLALEQILKINNLGMELSGGRLRVGSRRELAERRQRLRAPAAVRLVLRHADAGVVARALSRPDAGILGPSGTARAEPGNALVVRDTGARLLDVGRLLARVDLPAAEDEPAADLEARCLAVWRELRE